MIKIAICDDETAFLTELSAMLRSWAASRELVLQLFPFTNGDKLIAACEESPADLVILDIMMPFPGGMDTAKALRQKESHVPLIFLTSSPEFALESYEVRAGVSSPFRSPDNLRLSEYLPPGCGISGGFKLRRDLLQGRAAHQIRHTDSHFPDNGVAFKDAYFAYMFPER